MKFGLLEFLGADWRPILVGSLGTILGTAAVWMLSKLFRQKHKLIWNHESNYIDIDLGESDRPKSVRFHKLKIQNVGRGEAKNIKVLFHNKSSVRFELKRKMSNWSLHQMTLVSDDRDYSIVPGDNNTTLNLNSLSKFQTMVVTYASLTASDLGSPLSVICDGQIAQEFPTGYFFIRERDVYLRALKASWWIIPLLLALALEVSSLDAKS